MHLRDVLGPGGDLRASSTESEGVACKSGGGEGVIRVIHQRTLFAPRTSIAL